MMRFTLLAVVAILLSVRATAAEPLLWVKKPELTFDDKTRKWYASFELDSLTDVEATLVDPATNTVIRHLAAGVLGPKAPPPLAANSRSQRLEWDGNDDYRIPFPKPESAVLRVRAGMSVGLEQIAGGDPYAYFSAEMGHNDHSPFGINGLELKSDGKVYVLGHSSNLGPPALRQYDIDGVYLKTVFPPPAGKDAKSMQGWGINLKPDGTYTPRFNRLTDPSLSTTILDTHTGGMARLFPTPEPNRLSLWHTSFGAADFRMMSLNTDGTISQDPAESMQGSLVKSPSLGLGPISPNSHTMHSLLGPVFTCMAADGKHFYLSGLFAATTVYGSIKEIQSDGFWRDGQVWKVDLATRTAKPFFTLDAKAVAAAARDRKSPIGGRQSYSALHGIAVDPEGRVFVCDRLNKRVAVLDETGKLLREIPVEHPDAIAVSHRTGALFVTTRIGDEYTGRGLVKLLKFKDWRTAAEPAVSLQVSETGYTGHHKHSYVVICEKENSSNVWVAYTEMPVRIYKDDEQGFTLLKDFYNVPGAQRALVLDRIAVDPKTEAVYAMDDHTSVWRVNDWKNPTFVQTPLRTASVAVDARNRHIYIRTVFDEGSSISIGKIARHHLDEKNYPPAPFGNTGSNRLTPSFVYEWCFTGSSDRGFAIAPNGNLAVLAQRDGGPLLFYQGNSNKLPWESLKLATLGTQAGGIKFDLQGNLYVGYVDSKARAPLPGFEGDPFAKKIGRIHKYAPTGTMESGNLFPKPPEGPSISYDVPFGAFDEDCIVRSPCFSVDGFGRIYYPTNIAQRVAVVDNAGNEILHFGTYGNRDSRGGLPGDLVPTQGIPMGFPNSVDATDDFIYVGDMVNHRLLRIRKKFRAEAASR